MAVGGELGGAADLADRSDAGSVGSLSAFFPCYDDEASIASVVQRMARVLERLGIDGEIIVVNDGSSDESATVLEALSRDEPRLRIITHAVNRGYVGAAPSTCAAASPPKR